MTSSEQAQDPTTCRVFVPYPTLLATGYGNGPSLTLAAPWSSGSLPDLGRWLELTRENDIRSLSYLAEELLALGASKIALDTVPHDADFLPAPFAQIIISVSSDAAVKRRDAVLGPIIDELQTRFRSPFVGFSDRPTAWPETAHLSMAFLYRYLIDYFTAMEHRLHVEFSVTAGKNAASILRSYVEDSRSRALLASLSGLFASYRQCETPGLSIVSRARVSAETLDIFSQLLEDATYRDFSNAAWRLGLPEQQKHAVSSLRRAARKLVTRSPFREILNLVSRIVGVATGAPIPDSDLLSALLQRDYLPPVVSYRSAVHRAAAAWTKYAEERDRRLGG